MHGRKWLQRYEAWVYGTQVVLLLALVWQIWRELLQPLLLRLCNWADLMRGVNLDSRVQFRADSDFAELERDINMLGDMINNLSRDTEIQLQKHTDHISRESRSLAILYEVASSINLSHDLNELFERSLDSLCGNLNASAGIIRQFKGKNKKDIVASNGQYQRYLPRQRRPPAVDPKSRRARPTSVASIASIASIAKPCSLRAGNTGRQAVAGVVDPAAIPRKYPRRPAPVLRR